VKILIVDRGYQQRQPVVGVESSLGKFDCEQSEFGDWGIGDGGWGFVWKEEETGWLCYVSRVKWEGKGKSEQGRARGENMEGFCTRK
jgi:hypothetical protein